MRLGAIAGALLTLVLAGCNSTSSGGSAASDKPVVTDTPTPEASTPVQGGRAGVCTAFSDFYNLLTTNTPHDTADLVPAAERVGEAASVDPSKVSRRLFNDVNNFVAFVGSSSFPDSGSVNSPQIQRVQTDCG